MELSALAGNPRLKEMLSQREEGRGLSHAYMISGQVGSGRHTLARMLSAAMMCTAALSERPCGRCPACKKVFAGIHPDVIVTDGGGQGKSIAVDQVRAIRTDAYIRPNEGVRKVYLLEGADQMNPSAQNAMLKLLEEGPSYAAFLLLCDGAGTLLQTVRSRCEELSMTPVPLKECRSWLRARFPGTSEIELEQAALTCQGILGRAVEQLQGMDEGVQ
ncbi:MAG: DNA polymerase III subunit delta, partial [Lawsonibacter sp.]|nr:DNA polymerase III subunit delta [Lawsonibacter sp.]